MPSAYECARASAGYQGEGRGEDGFVPWLFNTHPHLNPPLEGEETCFRSWRKKTAYCISYAESYKSYSTRTPYDSALSGIRGQSSNTVYSELGGYFECRTVNFSATAALFSFSSKDEKATAGAFPEDLSSPAADR